MEHLERVPEANTWCHTARPYRFLMLDGRIFFPFFLWLVQMRWETFYFAAAATLLFGALEYARYPLPMLWRRVRATLAGRYRPARPPRRLFL